MKQLFIFLTLFTPVILKAQNKKPPVTIQGTLGISYEGYGLDRNPTGWLGYAQRKPYSQTRFNLQPTITFNKNFSLPVNLSFNTVPTNIVGPFAGIQKQSFKEFITNPANNFAVNPKYKWAELQLGTQYINFSNLSTGDVGIFGAGVDLRPSVFRFKFFTGQSQQGINFFGGGPSGSFARKNWMTQIGMEKEETYALLMNIAYGKDDINSIISPPTGLTAQEGLNMSVVGKLQLKGGWYFSTEAAQAYYTNDLSLPIPINAIDIKPFFYGNTSTNKDYALEGAIGKKSTNFDIGLKAAYLGAGFKTIGYPFLQPDRVDYTVNTRINAFKKTTNIVANVGVRKNNVSSTTVNSNQFIGNINWYTQFNNRLSLNLNYNNFGFEAASATPGVIGVRNVSNDISVSPTYTWNTKKINHVLTATYNYSKYDEKDLISNTITSNNTNTALLTYIPTYLTKNISPDFSIMYFNNNGAGFTTTLTSASAGLAMPVAKNKVQLRGQLQYLLTKSGSYTPSNNVIANCNIDVKLNKKITWTNFMQTNYFKYGNELSTPGGENYTETNFRTGFLYNLNKQ
jgi:hypothetical protein